MIMAARDVPPGQSWAFLDHRTVAEVAGLPEKFVEARGIEARKGVFDQTARPSYRKLCAEVLRRWGVA
ncbi:MAG: hypothetical protein F8N37_12185 [Telmatospirillum sp.]|nr:hypothetical protein [Telmatospirillum sp.]